MKTDFHVSRVLLRARQEARLEAMKEEEPAAQQPPPPSAMPAAPPAPVASVPAAVSPADLSLSAELVRAALTAVHNPQQLAALAGAHAPVLPLPLLPLSAPAVPFIPVVAGFPAPFPVGMPAMMRPPTGAAAMPS